MKALKSAGGIYIAHLLGVAVGVAMGVGLMGVYLGIALPDQCSASLTQYLAQQ